MKHLARYAAIAAVVGLCACSDDTPKNTAPVPEEGIPVRIALSFPKASRSHTVDPDDNTNSNSGYEIGQTFENHVGSILVVLASSKSTSEPMVYDFIAAGQADAPTSSDTDAETGKTVHTVRFRSQALVDYVAENGGATEKGAPVYVFAYCNPTNALATRVAGLGYGQSFVDLAMTSEAVPTDVISTSNQVVEDVSSIWTPDQFLMTNRTVPAPTYVTTEAILKSSVNNPVDLGTVEVHRAAARFDFKEKAADEENNLLANQYAITNIGTSDVAGYVTLNGMALFNISKSFYALEHLSTMPDWTPEYICVREWPYEPTASNNGLPSQHTSWVASTGYRYKENYGGANVSAYFTNATSAENFNPADLTYDPFPSTNPDNDEHWTPGTPGYYIWRYCTENTIPDVANPETGKPDVGNQKHGITTGVIFRGTLSGAEGSHLAEMLDGEEPVYMFDNVFYSIQGLVAAYNENQNTSLARYFKQMALADANKGVITFNDDQTVATLTPGQQFTATVKDGITIYRPDDDGNYNVYYYYYNRHNDNLNNILMHVMEFAVVRNNVYKLTVETVNEFGHPGNTPDDPEPEDPKDPDEAPKTYFKVNVTVVPWVVRVNNINL